MAAATKDIFNACFSHFVDDKAYKYWAYRNIDKIHEFWAESCVDELRSSVSWSARAKMSREGNFQVSQEKAYFEMINSVVTILQGEIEDAAENEDVSEREVWRDELEMLNMREVARNAIQSDSKRKRN